MTNGKYDFIEFLDYLLRPDDLPDPPDLDVPDEREPPPDDLNELPELLLELDLE